MTWLKLTIAPDGAVCYLNSDKIIGFVGATDGTTNIDVDNTFRDAPSVREPLAQIAAALVRAGETVVDVECQVQEAEQAPRDAELADLRERNADLWKALEWLRENHLGIGYCDDQNAYYPVMQGGAAASPRSWYWAVAAAADAPTVADLGRELDRLCPPMTNKSR
jgi:hypothetical protein